ncbi:MAG: DNA mismatch repair protein MutL [Deltaproteobacteria bacterium]|nr:MAG: DNA mismatch repair protein MutL [Deltaproteobacteria bacterium]
MGHIRILPDILTNKIAAGEVVERPASVVKELVENALDAGSSRIFIEIGKGGRSQIRVSDNGIGMSADDALLAIERYATSKIKTDADLFAINTLGFRGEALPSIAAVSKFTLITRERGADGGTQIRIDGGKIKDVIDVGAPPGTLISVEHLFFNTPARRKFLKTINTEMGHIADAVASIAMGWPEVQFHLHHDGRPVKTWLRVKNRFDRVADVLGPQVRGELLPIAFSHGSVSMEGWIAGPRAARSTSQKIYLYVNGRYVRDRGIQRALFEGFRGRLMKGRFPVAMVALTLDGGEVDVNVHPTKHEVRFADPRLIYDSIKTAVSGALDAAERNLSASGTRPLSPPPPFSGHQPNEPDRPSTTVYPPPATAVPNVVNEDAPTPQVETPPPIDAIPVPGPVFEKPRETEPPSISAAPRPATATPAPRADDQADLWAAGFFAQLTVIGQLWQTYILCESPDGLILIDQHAAHERIVFEQLSADGDRARRVQQLLMPETVELGYREAALLDALIPELARIGLEIEPFGGSTVVVKAVPALIDQQNPGDLIREMVEKMVEIGFSPGPETLADAMDACRSVMACHGAIRAHQTLTVSQMRQLLSQLDACTTPSHCPHGRPTWIQWSPRFLEKAFGRVV